MTRTVSLLSLSAFLLTMLSLHPCSSVFICGKQATTLCLAAGEPADFQYRVRVLVRNFDAPGVPGGWGELAAETIAVALEERGLAQALRPTYKTESEWDFSPDNIKIDDVNEKKGGRWGAENIDIYAVPERRLVAKEKKVPVSEFFVEGTLSVIETTWWLKADIFERGNRKKLKSASASGEGNKGLIAAAQNVAAQLESVYALEVVSHRAEALLRNVELQLMQRPLAAARLERMHREWPDALEPAAARLSLETDQAVPDPRIVVTWAAKVVASLRSAGPESQRFLLRLNLDPYDILAEQYEAEGKTLEAAAVHIEAGKNCPGDRRIHWLKAARLEAGLGREREAASAYKGALKLKPLDPETHLEFALLLEKLGDNAEAARCFRLFLKHAPESPRADEIRAKLHSLAPVVSPAP